MSGTTRASYCTSGRPRRSVPVRVGRTGGRLRTSCTRREFLSQPAAITGAGASGTGTAGVAHRRGRPGRRRVRGFPAGDTLGLHDHDPGARYGGGRTAADRHNYLEPYPRGPRRFEAPLACTSISTIRDWSGEVEIVSLRVPDAGERLARQGRGRRAAPVATWTSTNRPASPKL